MPITIDEPNEGLVSVKVSAKFLVRRKILAITIQGKLSSWEKNVRRLERYFPDCETVAGIKEIISKMRDKVVSRGHKKSSLRRFHDAR